MDPSWVITLLDDDGKLSNASFIEALDRQLKVWSRSNEEAGERWWAIESFDAEPTSNLDEFASALQKFLRDPTSSEGSGEARIKEAGSKNLNISLVGDVRSTRTRHFLHCLAKLLRMQALPQPLLDGRHPFQDLTIKLRALLYFPRTTSESDYEAAYSFFTQLHTLMSDEFDARRPFETVLFFQERNLDETNRGYANLSDEQAKELMVQSLFHLMIGESPTLTQLKQSHNTEYAAMGAVSVYYDWKAAQRRLAQALGQELLARFGAGDKAPFVDQASANATAKDAANKFSVEFIYQRLIGGESRPTLVFDPKLWGGARDRFGKLVSPWALYSKLLLLVYFQTFLKNLPYRVSEYARLFLYTTAQRLREYMGGRGEEIWAGDGAGAQRGLQHVIHEAFSSVLKGERGNARSMPQVMLAADALKEVYNPARVSAQLADTADLTQFDVLAVPDFLRPYYTQAQDTLSAEDEEHLYQRLVETVRAHPMPTVLFIEAILLGILLALVGFRILTLLSPAVINLEGLLSYPRLVRAVLFALPIVAALWRYHFMTLQRLRKQLLSYVAAILKHAQTRAREQVKQEVAVVCGRAQTYCDEVKAWAEELGTALTYPVVEPESYPSTIFQREVFKGFEVPGQVDGPQQTASNLGVFPLRVRESDKPFADFDESDKNVYLHKFLDDPENGSPLWQAISAAIPPDEEANGLTAEVARRCRAFAENVYRDFSLRQLDDLLPDAGFSLMQRLSFPSVNIQVGVGKLSVTSEWKYGKPELLTRFAVKNAESIHGTTLASLAAYRPLENLTDISVLRAVIGNVAGRGLDWNDLPSLFAAATSRVAQESGYGLISLADLSFISLEHLREEIANLEKRFGLRVSGIRGLRPEEEPQETETPGPELEV